MMTVAGNYASDAYYESHTVGVCLALCLWVSGIVSRL